MAWNRNYYGLVTIIINISSHFSESHERRSLQPPHSPKQERPVWETEPFARIPPRESRGSCDHGWGTSGNDGFSTIKYRGKTGVPVKPNVPSNPMICLSPCIYIVCMYNVCMNICQVHKCSISQNALWLRKSWDLGLFHLQTKPWMYMVSTPKKDRKAKSHENNE